MFTEANYENAVISLLPRLMSGEIKIKGRNL
jgi:hypothetical protein